jgi:hypothetical protein
VFDSRPNANTGDPPIMQARRIRVVIVDEIIAGEK